MAKKVEYQIVGRYMDGKEVTGYHLHSIETGKSKRFTKEQVCFLVGRGQVTNCTGQIYNDKVLLRGNGMSLDDLPVQYEDGASRNMERVGRVKSGTDAASAMTQFLIVGTIKSGRNTVGYVIQNAGCGIKKIKRQQVIELAQAGRIGNARVQNYQGKIILRGVGCNLDELPSENIEKTSETSGAQPTNTKHPLNGVVNEKSIQVLNELSKSIQKRIINITLGISTKIKPTEIYIECPTGESTKAVVSAYIKSKFKAQVFVNPEYIETCVYSGISDPYSGVSEVLPLTRVKSISEIVNKISKATADTATK